MDPTRLDLANPFRARINGAARDFGRAPRWCRALPYWQISARGATPPAQSLVGFIDWEPCDLLCGTDEWSHWALYDLRPDGTGSEHPHATISHSAVHGADDLRVAAATEYGHPVQLVLDVMDYAVDGRCYLYPAFGVCAVPDPAP